jgi:hypothetical protein
MKGKRESQQIILILLARYKYRELGEFEGDSLDAGERGGGVGRRETHTEQTRGT